MGKRWKGKGESVLGGIFSLHVAVYLFIYFWLRWVFVAAQRLPSSCSAWASHCRAS